jgi:hypothetical protein
LEEKVKAIPPPPAPPALVEPKPPDISTYDDLDVYNRDMDTFKQKYGEFVTEKTKRDTVEAENKRKQN